MRFHHLILIVVLFYTTSCEKNAISLINDASTTEEQLAIYGSVELEDGLLSFEDPEDFIDLAYTINNSSDREEFLIDGFNSMWSNYITINQRLTQNFDVAAEDQLSKYEKEIFQIDNDGSISPLNSSRMFASLLSPDGYVILAGNLHYFSDKAHIITIGNHKDLILKALSQGNSNGLTNVWYTSFEGPTEKGLLGDCANNNFLDIGVTQQSNGRRLRLNLRSRSIILNVNNGIADIKWLLTAIVENRRKKGFVWIRNWRSCEFSVTEQIVSQRWLIPGPIQVGGLMTVQPFLTTSNGTVADWEVLLRDSRSSHDEDDFNSIANPFREGRAAARQLDQNNGSIAIIDHGCL